MNATAQIKILIAEDANDQRAVLVALLQKAGYTTFEASEAYQARQIGQREVPDLILTDFKMPAGGGESLLQGLKKFAKTKSIPVIVITAAPDEATRARLVCDFLAGMTDGYAARTYKRLFSPDFGSIGDLVG